MKRTKEKRGITLIALIITIIVLLILAGVTISMVVGDNGVLKQAQNAKIKTEKAKDKELRGLTAAEAGGNLEMTWYQDEDKEVPIPAGFAVSQVEGENKVDDGLVVIDKNGNEFVWIPCGTWDATKKEYSTEEYEKAGEYSKISSGKGWKYNENYEDKEWSSPENQINVAKKSIKKYGGFYIARYEAGVPSNAIFYVPNIGGNYVGMDGKTIPSFPGNPRSIDSNINEKENLIPISKQGVQAWNWITQPNAKIVSENMYKDNNTVDSYLIDSNAWNYICEDIVKIIIGDDGLNDSTNYGNFYCNNSTDYESLDCLWAKHYYDGKKWSFSNVYKRGKITPSDRKDGNYIELATGASDDFKIYNIYDMAGNMWEWTMETSDDKVSRYYTWWLFFWLRWRYSESNN